MRTSRSAGRASRRVRRESFDRADRPDIGFVAELMRYEERELHVAKSSGVLGAPATSGPLPAAPQRPFPPPRSQSSMSAVSTVSSSSMAADVDTPPQSARPADNGPFDGERTPRRQLRLPNVASRAARARESLPASSWQAEDEDEPDSRRREQEIRQPNGAWVFARREPRDGFLNPSRRSVGDDRDRADSDSISKAGLESAPDASS